MSEVTTVSIPKPLAEKLKELIQGTGFGSVSSFVTYVMRQIVSEGDGSFDKAAEQKVKQRLRSLGYLQ